MVGRRTWIAGLFALLTAGTVPAAAATPALTTIADKLYKADGSRFAGMLFVEWRSFDTSQSQIPGATITVKVVDGVLDVALSPTTTAVPTAYYRVRYNSDGQSDFIEYWAVPPSSSSLKVRDVRIPGPASAGGSSIVSPLTSAVLITDVAGLRDELNTRAVRSAGLTPGRAAIVNSEGEIASAEGSLADCVHVDGSTGPCMTGAGLTANRAVVVDSFGKLATAQGSATDCVHADGSSGACLSGAGLTASRAVIVDETGALAPAQGSSTDCVHADGSTGACAPIATLTPERSAVIDSTGKIAAAAGTATDCLRVDGTSGPCVAAGAITPARAAVVDAAGKLTSASGTATDCVHVDGSAGPCAGGITYTDSESPAGAVDGVNATFTLAGIPRPATSLSLYRNGLRLRLNVDYTLGGNTVYMLTAPQSSDVLEASYRSLDVTAAPAYFIDSEVPSGNLDGVNNQVTLTTPPNPASSLQLYLNGLHLKAGTDYDLVGNVVTFRNGAVPEPGDYLEASYRY